MTHILQGLQHQWNYYPVLIIIYMLMHRGLTPGDGHLQGTLVYHNQEVQCFMVVYSILKSKGAITHISFFSLRITQ